MVASDNFYVRKDSGDFPGSPVVKNSPCNAGTQVDPWSREILRAAGQLSPGVTTT